MAFVPLVPATFNVSLLKALGQAFNSPAILGPTGSAINLSAWTDLVATASPSTPNPTGADVTFGTVTASSAGVLTLTTDATDLASVEPGTCRLIISGKPTSGDIVQALASGVLTVANS